jgi:H+-transporting ATPase
MMLYNVQVLTPIMIIALALLDDVPVMLIAYDNAVVSSKPVRWDMHRVLVTSAILAAIGIVQSSVLLRILHHRMQFPVPQVQTAMFLQLVVAGHLLLFCTRTKGPFWKPPLPNARLFWAITGTQVFAACMAAYGWLVTPISWELIGGIWLYNLAWLVATDLVKLATYRSLDNRQEGHTLWQRALRQPLGTWSGLHSRTT